ncbi:MAG: TauD/TfdA family dioxygenase [Acidimicrobiales bacterium]
MALLEAAGPDLNYGTLATAIDGLTVTVPGDPTRTYGPAPAADGDPRPTSSGGTPRSRTSCSTRADRVSATPLTFTALAGSLGAEVDGIDLAAPVAPSSGALRAAWLDHLVLVFRDQPLTLEAFEDFARLFGSPSSIRSFPGSKAIRP